jgi:photosystem II stability/assembly factor-like uncharacterized protein
MSVVAMAIRLMGTQVIVLGPRRAFAVPQEREGPILESMDGGKTWHPYSVVIE